MCTRGANLVFDMHTIQSPLVLYTCADPISFSIHVWIQSSLVYMCGSNLLYYIPVHVRIQSPLTIDPIFYYRYVYVRIQSLLTVHQSFYLMHAVKISLDRSPQLIVVNKQTESHKGLIFYLHEVKLVYNDYHPSPPSLLSLSCYLSGFFGVLPRLQKSTHPTRV